MSRDPTRPEAAEMAASDAVPIRSLAVKIGAIGCVLLALALAGIGVTLWLTWQLEGGAAAVNEAGRMRMQTWRLAQTLPTSDGTSPHQASLQQQAAALDTSLALLKAGDPARPLALPGDPRSAAAYADVQRRWAALRGTWLGQTPRPSIVATQAEAFVAAIDTLVDAIEQQLARWTTALNIAQFLMMALAIGAALTLLYAAQLLVFNPLTRLRAGLAAVESGNLSVRIDPAGQDEFGLVAAGFNRMAERLQRLYEDLERRVAHKTLHLEAERARLAALYDSAAFAARIRSLDSLAGGFATRVRKVARADGVAVRWSDEENRRYVMLASEGLPAAIVEAEHCVPTGDCYCGQPQITAETRVFPLIELPRPGLPDQRVDPEQCRKAGFLSVISVPLRLHERLVGEIDLFFRQAVSLDTDDRTVLDTMASHLAGAIEGLRAEALRREAAVADERGLLARELHDSIAQSLAFLKIQTDLLRDEITRQRPDRIQQTLGELDTGVRESLSDVRELLLHFRTRTNVEDIAPALRTTLTKFEHQTGLPTRLTISGDGMALAPDVQIQVLHVVQEALSNVRKHARASEVHVDVVQSPRWIVSVADDGCGIDDAARQADETHVGLRIMRERATNIGATLDIASAPGQGTRVTLTLGATAAASAPAQQSTAS